MEAMQFQWFKHLSEVRQDVVLNMIFNLGVVRFKGFKKMISALLRQDYSKAADEMLSSKWASQVKGRATMLAKMMKENKYPEELK